MSRQKAILVLCVVLWADSAQAQVDAFGDSLPPGALQRLGTIRWRAGDSYAAAVSPDGRRVFVGGDGIRIFDLETGLRLHTIAGEESNFRALAVSPDGKLLASAGYEGGALWELPSGKQLRLLKVKSVSVMSFTPDSKKLITGGADHERSVRVIDVASGKEDFRMLWHRRSLQMVACAPDNKTLVSASSDEDIRIVDLSTGELVHTINDGKLYDPAFALSPDGKTVAVAAARYQQKERKSYFSLRLFDVATGKARQVIDSPAGKDRVERMIALLFSPDGKFLVGSGEKELRVWEVGSDKEARAFSWDVAGGKPRGFLSGTGRRLFFTPDGGRLIAVGSVIRVWDFRSGKELHPPEGPQWGANSLSFAPDGKTIASCAFSDRDVIQLWDIGSGKLKKTLRGHEGYLRAVQFAPDGKLVSGGGDGSVRIWDVTGKAEPMQIKLYDPKAGEERLQVTTMRVSRDGQTVTVAAAGFKDEPFSKQNVPLFLWSLADGKLVSKRQETTNYSERLDFSGDGKSFVTHGDKGELLVKDIASGKTIRKLESVLQPGGEGVLNPNILDSPYAFSPDGRFVTAHGSRQRNEGTRYFRDQYATVVFDLATGKEIHRIPLDGWRRDASFSPDSRRLAGLDGRVVRIWDAATGKRLWESPPLDYRITSLDFSPDGTKLATALDNATILIWDVASTK